MVQFGNYGQFKPAKVGRIEPLSHTPANTLSDGISPAGKFIVASYLPLVRYNQEELTYIVISSGKPVALDSNKGYVPAGYALEAAAYKTALATSVAAADAQAVIRYTQLDVANGIKNAKGVAVTAGEPVVKSFFTGTVQDITVSPWVGVNNEDSLRHAGGDNEDPTTLTHANFNPRPHTAFTTDYHMQYPVVKDIPTMQAAPYAGIAAMVASKGTYTFGSFVTYDRESNFVPAGDAADIYGISAAAASTYVVGQISGITYYKDETTGAVVGNHNLLDKVVAPNAATASVLNQIPNSLNDGMGPYITYSGGYAVVNFGLIGR